jgi:hypothetical protein
LLLVLSASAQDYGLQRGSIGAYGLGGTTFSLEDHGGKVWTAGGDYGLRRYLGLYGEIGHRTSPYSNPNRSFFGSGGVKVTLNNHKHLFHLWNGKTSGRIVPFGFAGAARGNLAEPHPNPEYCQSLNGHPYCYPGTPYTYHDHWIAAQYGGGLAST